MTQPDIYDELATCNWIARPRTLRGGGERKGVKRRIRRIKKKRKVLRVFIENERENELTCFSFYHRIVRDGIRLWTNPKQLSLAISDDSGKVEEKEILLTSHQSNEEPEFW